MRNKPHEKNFRVDPWTKKLNFLKKKTTPIIQQFQSHFCQMTLHFRNFPETLNISSVLENCQNAKSFGKGIWHEDSEYVGNHKIAKKIEQIVIEWSVFRAIFCDFWAREPDYIANISDFLDFRVFFLAIWATFDLYSLLIGSLINDVYHKSILKKFFLALDSKPLSVLIHWHLLIVNIVKLSFHRIPTSEFF